MKTISRNSLPITIVGGGIGGLSCALALAQKNFSVVVLEQASQFGEIGAGLHVAPNALSVLDALGVGAEIKRDALLIEKALVMDGISGESVCDIPCDAEFVRRFGNPYAVAHRADVHGSLLRACQAAGDLVELRTQSRIVNYEQDADSVTVFFENGESLLGSALIAADGIRSVVRQKLIGDGEPKRVAAIFRALVPEEKMPLEFQKPYPTIWAGPGAHLIYYPVRGWTDFNVAATVVMPMDDVAEGKATTEEALEAFAGWQDTPLKILKLSAQYQRYLVRHRDPTPNWSNGNVTLLGDAAHPMVQYVAQGAAMALEDAVCLASCLDTKNGNFASAFSDYQDIRIVRSARVQVSSLMLGHVLHAGGVERLVRNSIFEGRTPDAHFDRFSWLYTMPSYVREWTCNRAL